MKKFKLLAAIMALMVLFSCEKNEIPSFDEQIQEDVVKFSSQVIEGKFIVVLEEQGTLKSATIGGTVDPKTILQISDDLFSDLGFPAREPEFVYNSSIFGMAVEMNNQEAMALASAPGVKGVYPDMWVTLNLPKIQGKPVPVAPTESEPWGIARIGGATSSTGLSNKAWIIDTGIDLDHPDLTVDKENGFNFVANTTVADDDNGHGTHCAGIVAAIDNNIGVIGVAAGATVVPVKVLNRRGSGTMSAIIAGVNWVGTYGKTGDVANMSLGGSEYIPLETAIINVVNAKEIKFSLAAGNESTNANTKSPAGAEYPGIFTIAAMNEGDTWASYSNYGIPPIEYIAPGTYIYSTYKGGAYATMSGTSMAAPHVCGLLLLNSLKGDGTVTRVTDEEYPIAHKL